jgi:hypothetical protein
MSRTALNQALAEGLEREFGMRYCRSCSSSRPAEGGAKRKGGQWRCRVCRERAEQAAKRRARP